MPINLPWVNIDSAKLCTGNYLSAFLNNLYKCMCCVSLLSLVYIIIPNNNRKKKFKPGINFNHNIHKQKDMYEQL